MENKPADRTFKVVSASTDLFNEDGRYSGTQGKTKVTSTPGKAAQRAASALFKLARKAGKHDKHIKFSIQEVTRGSRKHTYFYEANQVKLDKPLEIKFGDQVTLVHYKLELRAVEEF